MQPRSQLPRIVRFGRFELDVPAGDLRENGVKVKLQEQPFQVLCLLVDHPGEVLSRDELRIKLWPADTFVDFDHGLNAAIRRLRDALGDSAEKPHFIETMARRGYRFIAPVEWLDDTGHFTQRIPLQNVRRSADRTKNTPDFSHRMRQIRNGILIFCLGLGVMAIAKSWSPGRVTQTAQDSDAPAALRVFWSRFVYGGEPPLVIFSNAKFVGRPDIALHYYDAKRDGNLQVFDHYTGVGETLAIHELDRVFALLHREIRVKRGSLLELDDAKINNLIFVGSPLENLSLLEIPGTQEFVFRRVEAGPLKGYPELVNVHPRAGEANEFLMSPPNGSMTEDYGVIASVPGLMPDQSVLILAGTTTMGTQAAVEYVCHPKSVEALLQRLSIPEYGHVKPFEAVIRVKISRGVPVTSELVTIHSRPS